MTESLRFQTKKAKVKDESQKLVVAGGAGKIAAGTPSEGRRPISPRPLLVPDLVIGVGVGEPLEPNIAALRVYQ